MFRNEGVGGSNPISSTNARLKGFPTPFAYRPARQSSAHVTQVRNSRIPKKRL